jgi:LCP family protein required for cell wall assembly
MTPDKLPYKTYRARRKPWDRFKRSQFDELRASDRATPGEPDYPPPPPASSRQDEQPPPKPRGQRPQPKGGRQEPMPASRREPKPPRKQRSASSTAARKVPWLKVGKYFLIWAVSWVVLSAVLFVISATIQQSKVSDQTNAQLGGGGNFVTGPGNVLVMGLDKRPSGSKEPGAGGPSRTDSLMLLRTGGGEAQRLSILRDSYADIPGYAPQKINAAYAYGGAALTVKTVENFIGGGMKINHIVIVDFEKFPDLIDALGGVKVEVKERCIHSTFGGKTFKLSRGEHKLNGEQALRYARVRKNSCDVGEDDRDRAARQQQVMSAMKSKAFSPFTFIRLPWIAWAAPKAIVTDMSPFTLMGFLSSMTVGKTPATKVLKPSGPGPGNSLIIPEGERARAARRFQE